MTQSRDKGNMHTSDSANHISRHWPQPHVPSQPLIVHPGCEAPSINWVEGCWSLGLGSCVLCVCLCINKDTHGVKPSFLPRMVNR